MYTDKKSLGHQLTTRLYDSMCITNYHLTKNIYHSVFFIYILYCTAPIATNFPRSCGTLANSKLLPADLAIFYSPLELQRQ